MLPIEKAAKKLNKKQEKDRYVNVFISCSTCRYFNLISMFNYYFISVCRKLAEAELQTNISEMEKYTLPSGQEIEKENILFI